MDELDALLGNLGKDMGGSGGGANASTQVDLQSLDSLVAGLDLGSPQQDRLKDRLQEKRVSRRMSRRGGMEVSKGTPAAATRSRPTSGLDDLEALMNELGGGSSTPAAAPAPAPAPVPQATRPASTAVTAKTLSPPTTGNGLPPRSRPVSGLDELDALMAGLDSFHAPASTSSPSPPTSGPTAQKPTGASKPSSFTSSAAPAAAASGRPSQAAGDGLMDDLDAIMASLGGSEASSGPASAPAKVNPVRSQQATPSRLSVGAGARPASQDFDLDSLIGSLSADTTSNTLAQQRKSISPPSPYSPSLQSQPQPQPQPQHQSSYAPHSPTAQPYSQHHQPQQQPYQQQQQPYQLPYQQPYSQQPPHQQRYPPAAGGMGLGPGPAGPGSAGLGAGAMSGVAAKGMCTTCSKPIYGQMLQALGKVFHPNCFVCGNCGSSLGTGSFYQTDGLPQCQRCYQSLFCARCAHCDQPIEGSCITAIGKKWHVNCFSCAQCLKPFGTSTFFERDSNAFCQSCFYGIFSSRCASCERPISSDTVNALGRQWHPECFACTHCKKVFGSEPYFEHNGRPYCKLHYHTQQGTTCGCGCGRPVMGRVVHALGKQWLPEHFVCAFCMNGIAGQNYSEKEGKPYCSVCHTKLYG
ncbi:LIM domain-binding protein 3 [Balamuthia mandrillaris]